MDCDPSRFFAILIKFNRVATIISNLYISIYKLLLEINRKLRLLGHFFQKDLKAV
jgi:hypothetical protein